jgi:transposase-like protein
MVAQLPPEKRDLIVQLFENGETNKTELARRAAVSKPTVYKVLEEEGLYVPSEEGDELEDAYEEEEDADELEALPAPPRVMAGVAAGFVAGFVACYLLLQGLPGGPNLPPPPPTVSPG